MGLPAALKAHANKDYNTAAHHYQRALEQKSFKPELFQNYGALLRQLGQIAKAKSVYEQGIKLYPKESAIFRNYANLIREEEPVKALAIYFNLLHADFADPHLNECDINFCPLFKYFSSSRNLIGPWMFANLPSNFVVCLKAWP